MDEAHAQASVGPGVYYVAVDSDGADDADYELHVTVFSGLRHTAAGTLKTGDEVTASLTWRPGATVTAELVDSSGLGAREVATFVDDDGSGAYTATWQVRDGEDGDGLTLRARVADDDRTRLVAFPGEIAVDTTPPRVQSASHDARTALGVGGVLRVTAVAESGAFGAFSLLRADGAAARADVPMAETEDGQYAAEFVVRATDHLLGGTVRVTFEDEVGNQATRDISRKLTIDTLPPAVESVSHDAERALVEGDTVGVTTRGDVGARGSFAIIVDGDTPFREDIPTFDDGAHDDGDADDGVYRGEYTVRPGDIALGAVVRARLEDDAGNAAYAVASTTVTIDASTPTIAAASHDADTPLPVGATLRVTVTGSPGADGSFEIRRADGTVYRADLRLVETGGEYAGAFDVGVGADLVEGVVTVTLRKANGKTATRTLAVPVTFDTTPPRAVLGVVARDVDGDEGGFIALSWDASSVADFERYDVYRSPTPLASVDGRSPETLDLFDQRAEFVLVPAATGVAQYFAVVALDEAGNASGLSLEVGGSVSARAEAADNLPPLPIRNVVAIDRPNDGGGALSVVWEPTPALDFAEYRLYVSDLPFILEATPRTQLDVASAPVVRLRTPSVTVADVPTLADGVEIFVTVSAVDAFGNESVVGPGGVSGPVVSEADGAPTSGGGFAIFGGPTGVARHSSAAFRWSRFGPRADAIDDYRFSVDGGPARFTGATEALLTGLTPGEHIFSVASADGSLPAVTRRFSVDPVAIPEREPNDAPDLAMGLPPGVAVDGVLADAADIDRFRVQLSAPAQVGLHLARAGAGVARLTLTSPSFAAGSEELATISADGLATPNAHATMVLDAGEYLLHVTGDAGAYRAVVAAYPAPTQVAWDLEPNDDPRRATLVFAETVEISGAANREGDIDWYRVPIPADGFPIVELDIAQAASADASTFEIYHDAPGEGRTLIGSVTLTPDEPAVSLRAGMRAGDLLIAASASAGTVYAARVGFAPLPPDVSVEVEPNGTVETASAVALGRRMDASLWGADDIDWRRVDADPNPGGVVALTLEAAERGAVVEAEAFTVGLDSLGVFLPSPSAPNAYALIVPSVARSFFVRVAGTATDYTFSALALSRAEHDADRPLGAGAELTVTIQGADGWDVRAEIASYGIEFPLTVTTPGLYVGTYAVDRGADVREAPLVVVIDTPRGVTARVPLSPSVTLDTVPPTLSNAGHNGGRPLRADEEISISATSEPGSLLSYEIAGGPFRVLGDMFDDGTHGDGEPGDGVYVGVYRVRPGDAAVGAAVTVSAEDGLGNARAVTVSRLLDLDTTPPLIEQVSHSGGSVLRAGDRLVVTAHGDAGARGSFSVEGVRDGLPLVDDGTRGDETAGDGVYVGSTLVLEGDNTPGAIVSVRLTDTAGNVATAHAALPVSIDTEAPPIDAVTHNSTAALREGERLVVRVTGEPGGSATFDIGADRRDIAMFDDGEGDDDTANDGVYTGAYVVRRDDDLPEALVTARVADS
ncbi:MAG: choice-of-anchor X domain-containing protein, partial [Candidatus Poribacteria bacterium]